jgi:phosphoribosylaminoimidazolecarboxamide formyltransferase/IMP cyclohydrolase
MLRSAAKNHQSVAVICNPGRYPQIIAELKKNNGALSAELMRDLAIEVFNRTSLYDGAIYSYLSSYFKSPAEAAVFPKEISFNFEKIQDLRYGENPHQQAAFYKEKGKLKGIINAKQLQGKELSFNNILDLNSAWELVKEFSHPAAVIVKHNNPCGAAEDKNLKKAYLDAWKCDQLSAFGGIVALNRKMDPKTAKAVLGSGFLECIIAPGFEPGVLDLFQDKKNLRLLELNELEAINEPDFKRVSGGLLLQDKDLQTLNLNNLKVVTKNKPTKEEMQSLIFGWKVAKHVKSNAIILTKGTKTIGIGAGQMSRVDSVFIATKKAGKLTKGSVLASDAFFPKEDAIALAAKYKIKAIIQPGGSIADEAIIKMADKHKIAMVSTGIRHFRH